VTIDHIAVRMGHEAARQNSYVINSHDSSNDATPDIRSLRSVGVGARASVGVDSDFSIAVAGSVYDSSPRSLVIGGNSGSPECISIGLDSYTQPFTDRQSYATISTAGSVAIGHGSQSRAAGEVALGSASGSHMSGIPIRTENPSAGGTFIFKAVAGYDTAIILADLESDQYTFTPNDNWTGTPWVIHVQGIVVARADNSANDKVVKVEWITGGSLTQTVMTNGANNLSLGLALNGMRLQSTVAAVAGLRLTGYLHITKISS